MVCVYYTHYVQVRTVRTLAEIQHAETAYFETDRQTYKQTDKEKVTQTDKVRETERNMVGIMTRRDNDEKATEMNRKMETREMRWNNAQMAKRRIGRSMETL